MPDLGEIFGLSGGRDRRSSVATALLLRALADMLDAEDDGSEPPTEQPFLDPEVRVRTQFTPIGG